MHVTGRILVWLLLPAAIVAFLWSARLVEHRGKWMKQVQQAKAQNEKTAVELAEARRQSEQAQGDLQREMLRWDRFWTNVNAGFLSPNNTILANIGSASGIVPGSALYAFQLATDGAPSYVGLFNAAQVQAAQASLQPMFRVREEDVPKWNGQTWRFRTMIPASYASRVANLETELVVADELLAKQRSNLAAQVQLIDAAREQREDRIGELLGGRKADPNAAGLVAEISKADDQRNLALAKVDEQRRMIRDRKETVRRLIQENNDLAQKLLNQAGPTKTASR